MFILKVHSSKDGRVLVCVSDKDLVGKLFTEGNKQLDLTKDFFKGNPCTAEEAGDVLRNADFVYLTGEHSIKLGLEEGIIEEESVLRIDNIPHIQAQLM